MLSRWVFLSKTKARRRALSSDEEKTSAFLFQGTLFREYTSLPVGTIPDDAQKRHLAFARALIRFVATEAGTAKSRS